MKLKNFVLSLGTVGTVVSPLATVIACGDKKDDDGKEVEVKVTSESGESDDAAGGATGTATPAETKTPTITVVPMTGVAAAIQGTGNTRTLAYDKTTDSAVTGADINIAFTMMVTMADGDSTTTTDFVGAWDNPDLSVVGKHVLTVTNTGYEDVTLTVTVS